MKVQRSTAIGITVVVIVLVGLSISGRLSRHDETAGEAVRAGRVGCAQVVNAFREQTSGEWITMAAQVNRTLLDEQGASTHQRFILRCSSGLTVLIVNNVNVGARAPVRQGESVVVRGQYIWNRLGGLIHDTHHSTDSNPPGWIYVNSGVYQ